MMKISKKNFLVFKEKRFVKENEETIAILENILFLEMKSSNLFIQLIIWQTCDEAAPNQTINLPGLAHKSLVG